VVEDSRPSASDDVEVDDAGPSTKATVEKKEKVSRRAPPAHVGHG
jgi:hypothetical protein